VQSFHHKVKDDYGRGIDERLSNSFTAIMSNRYIKPVPFEYDLSKPAVRTVIVNNKYFGFWCCCIHQIRFSIEFTMQPALKNSTLNLAKKEYKT
jgi:hypothetical protein